MVFDNSFFRIDQGAKPAKGRLMLAEPFMNEPYFGRSVVLLTQHSDNEGSMGLVLNKPLDIYLHEVIEGMGIEENIRLFCGGPVGSKSLFYLHNMEDLPHSFPITQHLFLGGDFDQLIDNINQGLGVSGKVRFFLGYSGWESEQLDQEIKHQSWIVGPVADESVLFVENAELMWMQFMKALGGKYRHWADFPQNPNLN
ncbi:YqgE/AlgH family protein [Microbacter margulisiae]|uniref:Putative transcriptional regulator n=1 Tax=Microbacter margulisiae TaxID=1350067 RepID=A0A7W5DPJ8_9PORP|nr:YqgE/AlgH family protein [Microbacter margulisiae]MBB3186671.1 putative transcriptional regulator [Microbacter margulisiae]